MMDKIREETASALQKAKDTMERFYNRNKKESINYQIGDKVLLDGSNLKIQVPARKLGPKNFGPFEVIEKIGSSAYKLLLPTSWRKVHPVFNEVLLIPYKPPSESNPQLENPPLPEIIDGENEFDVEEILDSRITKKGLLEYLVSWKGYPVEENTWEPARNVKNSEQLVKEFHSKYPDKPQSPLLKRTRFMGIMTRDPNEPIRLFNWNE